MRLILSLRSFILDVWVLAAFFRLLLFNPGSQSRVTGESLESIAHPEINLRLFSSSLAFLQLKQCVVQRGRQMGVRNLAHCEVVEHTEILGDFVRLVLINGHVPVVNRDEVDELAVVLDFVRQRLDVLLISYDVLFYRALRLEKALHRCLTEGHLLKLGLLFLLLYLDGLLCLDNLVTAVHCVPSTQQI